jgi:hypothetical protein
MVKTKSVFKEIKYMRKLLITLVLFVGSHSILAQDLEQAGILVELARSHINFPQRPDTMTAEISKTLYFGDTSEVSESKHVLDLKGDRLYQETNDPDLGKLVIRYDNRKASVEVNGQEQAAMSSTLNNVLGDSYQQILTALSIIPDTYNIISYDGVKTYSNLVVGEQVTLKIESPLLGEVITSAIFDRSGFLLATISETWLGKTLILYDIFTLDNYLRVITQSYILDSDDAKILEDRRADYFFNKPIDESLFSTLR